jgi:hypothetical protein
VLSCKKIERIGVSRRCREALEEGAAYQFNIVGTAWSEVSKYTASDPNGNDWFGHSVGAGSYALVGAYLDDEIGFDAGAAYVRELCP